MEPAPLLPGRQRHEGVTACDNRLFVEAVLYRCHAGIAWRDLPGRFGDFRVVHLRFSRWAKSGVWQQLLQALSQEADNAYAMIDSTMVRAHQHSAGGGKNQAIGRSRGGLGTKTNAAVDALGNPAGFCLTPGCASGLDGTDVLPAVTKACAVIAGKAFDADERVIAPLRADRPSLLQKSTARCSAPVTVTCTRPDTSWKTSSHASSNTVPSLRAATKLPATSLLPFTWQLPLSGLIDDTS